MPNIFDDIKEKGYVVFNLNKSDLPNYYPGAFNNYPGVSINKLNVYDIITIKIFMLEETGRDARIVDGYIDLTVESIEDDKVIADILTALPEENFPLSTGDWMELLEEEILFYIPVEGYLKDRVVN